MQKHITENVYTAQGHLNQERQGLQARKRKYHGIFHKTDNEINRDTESLKKEGQYRSIYDRNTK